MVVPAFQACATYLTAFAVGFTCQKFIFSDINVVFDVIRMEAVPGAEDCDRWWQSGLQVFSKELMFAVFAFCAVVVN